MDSITSDFWQVLLWSFWIFVWVAALMIWFRCLFDMFGDRSLSGWAKAGWAIVLVLVPWLGAIVYLIARGRSMGERQMAEVTRQQEMQEQYIREVAGNGTDPTRQIADAKALLDSGAINEAEYSNLKSKAMAG